MAVGAELNLQETVHDVHYLHNESLFAVAQEKYTYIYDNRGVEVHCLADHERTHRLDFLPYHYLLVTTGHSGYIKWRDVSTGQMVASYQTGHGPVHVLKHNRVNAVSHVGHSNGVVSLWSPAAGKALVSMFCHKSSVNDVAIDREGIYMATAGMDGMMKIWDLRKYQCVHSYRTDAPVMSLDISDMGLIAMGLGREAQVLKDAFTRPTDVTYIRHEIRAPDAKQIAGGGALASRKALASSISVSSVCFRPLEDVLAIGHSHGISTIVVPGAGEPNFDSFESNPFMNTKQRREAEIQSLMNKLSHDMIGLGEYTVLVAFCDVTINLSIPLFLSQMQASSVLSIRTQLCCSRSITRSFSRPTARSYQSSPETGSEGGIRSRPSSAAARRM
jgi:U3 small nucleolar RNA-associated protein 7